MALFFQDEDNIIGTSFMPYVQNVAGLTGVNYRSEPYKYREEQGCSLGKVFQPCKADKPEDPATPIIESHAGDPVRIHVIGANNEQNGMFSVEKHEWPIEPFMRGADQISVVEFSGSEVLDAFVPSAGGPYRCPVTMCTATSGCRTRKSGQWGYLRVLPAGDQRLLPLAGAGAGMKSASLDDAAQVIPVTASSVEYAPGKGRRRREGGGREASPFFFAGFIWYDDQIALFRIDLGGMMKGLLLMLRLAADGQRNRLGLRRNSGDRWGNHHRKGHDHRRQADSQRLQSGDVSDPVYCGKNFDRDRVADLEGIRRGARGGLKDTVVWLADASKGKPFKFETTDYRSTGLPIPTLCHDCARPVRRGHHEHGSGHARHPSL